MTSNNQTSMFAYTHNVFLSEAAQLLTFEITSSLFHNLQKHLSERAFVTLMCHREHIIICRRLCFFRRLSIWQFIWILRLFKQRWRISSFLCIRQLCFLVYLTFLLCAYDFYIPSSIRKTERKDMSLPTYVIICLFVCLYEIFVLSQKVFVVQIQCSYKYKYK